MHIHLITYMLKSYSRSYRYFPPLIFCLLGIVLVYSYRPNPIMESYAITSIVIYLISAWFCYSFIHSMDETQGHILILHSGSVRTYLIGQMVTVLICCFLLSLFALFYPITMNMFDETVRVYQLLLALLVHVELALLGILVALFFNKSFYQSARFSIAMIFIVLIITTVKDGVIKDFGAGLAFLFWLLPPASQTFNLLIHVDAYSNARIVASLIHPLVYFVLLFSMFIWLWKKRM